MIRMVEIHEDVEGSESDEDYREGTDESPAQEIDQSSSVSESAKGSKNSDERQQAYTHSTKASDTSTSELSGKEEHRTSTAESGDYLKIISRARHSKVLFRIGHELKPSC